MVKSIYYILLFGVGTTIVTFLVTALATSYYNNAVEVIINDTVIDLETSDILLFSAAISSTDSVAALTMIDSVKYPKLFSVIFGESNLYIKIYLNFINLNNILTKNKFIIKKKGMVNDAVSIVVYLSI